MGEASVIVQAIRSMIFYILFLGQTIVLAILLGTIAVFMRSRFDLGWRAAQYWNSANRFLLRWVVGIRTEVHGAENIPQDGCIIASKHQSDWDIFAILPHTDRPAFIAKKELMDIPFFGWIARNLDTITIDRKKGSQAIAAMTDDARQAIAKGCKIIIFPEGTRTAPLSTPNYRFGTARLYAALDVPVVPVAVNSGLFWGRNSLILWPGTARATFLPPILPGLSAEQFHEKLVQTIEIESDRLSLAAAEEGLARPLTSSMHERLKALREARTSGGNK